MANVLAWSEDEASCCWRWGERGAVKAAMGERSDSSEAVVLQIRILIVCYVGLSLRIKRR
jgi:hypothetical protein